MTLPNPVNSPVETNDSIRQLEQSVRALRSVLQIVLIAVLILTGSVCIPLLRQLGQMRRQIQDMSAIVENYETNYRPLMDEFRNKLFEFSKVHPDFKPIFLKYFNPTGAVTSTSPLIPNEPTSGSGAPRMPATPQR